MKIKCPCGPRVVIRLKRVEKMSKGGIALPEDLTRREQYGTTQGYVVQIGDGVDQSLVQYEVGDLVCIDQYVGADIEDGETVYRIIEDINVQGVLEEEEDA